MTLDDLRTQLQAVADLPGDTLVVLSKDAEGNGFSPLNEVEQAMYVAENTWSGERCLSDAQRQATGSPDDYAEAPDDAVPALFLWPVN